MSARTKLRFKLWAQDSRCRDCGCPTVLLCMLVRGENVAPWYPSNTARLELDRTRKSRPVILCCGCWRRRRRNDPLYLGTRGRPYGNTMSADVKRRLTLWESDPRCRRCGRGTVLVTPIRSDSFGNFVPGGALPPNAATLEHVYSRLHPRRQRGERGERTLFCYECNHSVGRDEVMALPLEERWRRGGRWPQAVNS